MSEQIDRLEQAGFAAWPAVRSLRIGGWLVRISGGYTKRANSANWVADDGLAVSDVITRCTDLFDAAGLRATFRLVERRETAAMDAALEHAGWVTVEPSLVMLAPDAGGFGTAADDPAIELVSMPEWAAIHASLAAQPEAVAARHFDILNRIAVPTLPAVARLDGVPVACGLGVIDGPLLGYFDILTAPAYRGRGLARRLMAVQAAAARRRGVGACYLQVVAANAPAIGLYRKLGFREAYRYHYRLPPPTAETSG